MATAIVRTWCFMLATLFVWPFLPLGVAGAGEP